MAAVESVFTESERLALSRFLAGYTGLTREAYAANPAVGSPRATTAGQPRQLATAHWHTSWLVPPLWEVSRAETER